MPIYAYLTRLIYLQDLIATPLLTLIHFLTQMVILDYDPP